MKLGLSWLFKFVDEGFFISAFRIYRTKWVISAQHISYAIYIS